MLNDAPTALLTKNSVKNIFLYLEFFWESVFRNTYDHLVRKGCPETALYCFEKDLWWDTFFIIQYLSSVLN